MVKPAAKRAMAAWAEQAYDKPERHICRLFRLARSTKRYAARKDPQAALRRRLRELAAVRVRWGYRRLTVLLRREGWPVNAKRIYRLYREEELTVRTAKRKKLAQRARVASPPASKPNERWAMDFVADRFSSGYRFRILTMVDLYTRECLALSVDRSIGGKKVAAALDSVVALRGAPESITVDNGTEFVSRAMESWSVCCGVRLDFIRPGRPVENAFIESFNGRLRDECLNVEIFDDLRTARRQIERWRLDYNDRRPHSALGDRTPNEFARAAADVSSKGTRAAGEVKKRSTGPRQGSPNGGPCGAVLDPSQPISWDPKRRTMSLAVSSAFREDVNLAELGPPGPRKSSPRATFDRKSLP